MLAVATADVSHLAGHYLPPNYHIQNQQQHHHHHHPSGIQQMTLPQNHRPSNERVETTIEKHELIELPTQIEIIKEGQPIYGVLPENEEMLKSQQQLPEIRSQYLPPSPEIENLQPPQVPFEMPMRTYLPPVETEPTTTDMPPTTTTLAPPTTTFNPTMEESTTEQESTTEENQMTTTTEMPETSYDTTTTTSSAETMTTMPENRYLPPLTPAMPQNHYLPPSGMMLPPLESMPQLTYQQYQEQLMHEQHMQQMYREQEMQEMLQAIAEMEKQQMIALEPQEQHQQQPVAPVEPAHVLREDGYHYKTAENDLRRYRYRH